MNTESWIALSSVVGVLAAALLGFWGWKRRLLASLRAGSRIAETSRGSVEYALSGQGFVVLYFHGTVGGYDQGLAAASFINGRDEEAQFTILAPSRPGYLRTPLETGCTPEQQADAMAALLDHLGIDKVAVIGASGGGPFALQFALRHPDHTSALVMFSAITRRIAPRKRARMRQWLLSSRGGLFLLDLFLSTFLHLMLRRRIAWLARRLFRDMTARTATDADIRHRVEAMLDHADQVRFFRMLVRCMLPLSARAAGILNDERQIAVLPEYPLERIVAPTLVLQGLEDCAASPSHVKFVADKIPGAEVYAIERCGHFIWVGEHSQRMRAALVEFLRKHAAPGGSAAGVCERPASAGC